MNIKCEHANFKKIFDKNTFSTKIKPKSIAELLILDNQGILGPPKKVLHEEIKEYDIFMVNLNGILHHFGNDFVGFDDWKFCFGDSPTMFKWKSTKFLGFPVEKLEPALKILVPIVLTCQLGTEIIWIEAQNLC